MPPQDLFSIYVLHLTQLIFTFLFKSDFIQKSSPQVNILIGSDPDNSGQPILHTDDSLRQSPVIRKARVWRWPCLHWLRLSSKKSGLVLMPTSLSLFTKKFSMDLIYMSVMSLRRNGAFSPYLFKFSTDLNHNTFPSLSSPCMLPMSVLKMVEQALPATRINNCLAKASPRLIRASVFSQQTKIHLILIHRIYANIINYMRIFGTLYNLNL